MTSHMRVAATLTLVASCALLARAAGHSSAAAPPLRLSEAELFFELNDTDGDLGIHASVDGGPWTELSIEGPRDRQLLRIVSRGMLRTQGLTQLSFESAEPAFDELAPEDFFRRFPEGKYEIEGRTHEGNEVGGRATLSHVLADRPRNVRVSGLLAAENCDAPVLPIVAAPVTISWDAVTASHPALGRRGPVKVSRYQLFVERDDAKLSVDLPPDVTSFEVPAGFTSLGDEFKFEIIVRTTSGNNTAVESCFVVM